MMDLYIIPIEPIDTRYTRGWYDHIPQLIDLEAKKLNKDVNIIIVDGENVPPVPTPGAFLDFGATNIYKSSQLEAIAEKFRSGQIKSGSKFLYTDAWNPTVVQLKYMSSLLNIPIEIHGLWHAGSYDPHDFLGRLIGDAPWVRHAEKSMVECYTTNWFATEFHLDMFIENLYELDHKNYPFSDKKARLLGRKKVDLTGWPLEYLPTVLEPYSELPKKNSIVFPHRLAPEKQLDIFKDLESSLPQYEWIVCQEKKLTKHEYHTILGESSMTFSANTQETLGISTIEALLCRSMAIVPNRLSYTEMYQDSQFMYPSIWTKDFDTYLNHKDKLIAFIDNLMMNKNSNIIREGINDQIRNISNFINATPLINALLK